LKGEIFFIADEAESEKQSIDKMQEKVEALLEVNQRLEEYDLGCFLFSIHSSIKSLLSDLKKC
jgi:hypothetical protein